MEGIQESKDLLVAVNEVSIHLVKLMKDGVQLEDAAALMALVVADGDLKLKLFAAYENAQKIPAEMKDLSLQEGLELAGIQVSYVPRLVEAFKKV